MSESALLGRDEIRSWSILDTRQQAAIQDPEEDWTGITNPEVRRKLQNRLHQRLWRRRQAEKRKTSKTTSTDTGVEVSQTVEFPSQYQSPQKETTNVVFNPEVSLCGPNSIELMEKLAHFETFANQEYRLSSPRSDLLLTLIRFNIFRALMDNNHALGFTLAWLDEDAISPFYQPRPYSQSPDFGCPQHLRPTRLQQTVEHHPWIDLFPLPQMRDNILRAGESFDDAPLCFDLVDNRRCLGEWSGLIVWGDPWDPRNWEISEDFLKKWSWVVQGCWELIESSNQWRARRGEPKLISNDLQSPEVPDKSTSSISVSMDGNGHINI